MVLAISSALRAPAKGEACRSSVAFSSFGRHDGDDALNGIFFEEGPPLPPKVGRGRRPTVDISPQVPARQGKNRLGVFQCAVAVISGVRLRRPGSSGKPQLVSIAKPYMTTEQPAQ